MVGRSTMTDENRLLRSLMRTARRLFRNTPVQQWSLTTRVYKFVARRAFKDDFVNVPFRGITIMYPGGDHTTLPSLVEGYYEKTEIDHVVEFLDALTAPVTAYDIGANVGIWTCLLARHPLVKSVVAFEPSQENLGLLRANLNLNGCAEKVTIVEAAVSNRDGVIKFLEAGSGATRRIASDDGAVSISVDVVRLDTFAKSHNEMPGLVKVDVEGFEPHVIEGMRSIIQQCMPALLLEYSLIQSDSAGTSWDDVGPWLTQEYGTVQILDDAGVRTASDFSALKSDKRLLNLFFSRS